MNSFFGFCLKLLILYGIKLTKTEIFTSLVEVKELFDIESVLVNNFEEYLLMQERKLEYLILQVQEHKMKRKDQVAKTNITLYLSKPINAYLLLKRLTLDWRSLENLIIHYNVSSAFKNITSHKNILKYPSMDDITGAAQAIFRLQNTYNLDIATITKGEYHTEMTSHDCLLLALHSSVIGGQSHHTLAWMNEAMSRYVDEPKYKMSSNSDNAIKILIQLRDVIPNDNKLCNSETPIEKVESDTFQNSPEKIVKMMCRNELKQTPRQLRPLKCHYVTNNVPFLKIAPLKRETASISPFIVIYHEAMYDNEIELIKEIAKTRLERALVVETGLPKTVSSRIAKTAWIETKDDKIIQNIVQRTEDMTGLNMETAEELQVVNYGIGGHYVPHYDFIHEGQEACQSKYDGNRIATVLFYLNDVVQGGATIFPKIQTIIFPKKGTAAFWYNLYASGIEDDRTMHAACPVLSGFKWVANKWINERGQEFRRQCDIIPEHHPVLQDVTYCPNIF